VRSTARHSGVLRPVPDPEIDVELDAVDLGPDLDGEIDALVEPDLGSQGDTRELDL
jgi:hypothetical protein